MTKVNNIHQKDIIKNIVNNTVIGHPGDCKRLCLLTFCIQ